MQKSLIFVFGIISYLVGMGGLAYFVLFLGRWEFLPVHINSGTPGPVGTAIAVNLGILLLFGVQHTLTARPGFKAALTKAMDLNIDNFQLIYHNYTRKYYH